MAGGRQWCTKVFVRFFTESVFIIAIMCVDYTGNEIVHARTFVFMYVDKMDENVLIFLTCLNVSFFVSLSIFIICGFFTFYINFVNSHILYTETISL